jgi:hypothetical protein
MRQTTCKQRLRLLTESLLCSWSGHKRSPPDGNNGALAVMLEGFIRFGLIHIALSYRVTPSRANQ